MCITDGHCGIRSVTHIQMHRDTLAGCGEYHLFHQFNSKMKLLLVRFTAQNQIFDRAAACSISHIFYLSSVKYFSSMSIRLKRYSTLGAFHWLKLTIEVKEGFYECV